MPARFATVTASTLNVRSGPGTEFSVVRQLRRDERVEVSAVQGNWLALLIDGKPGFAHKNFLFLPETEPPAGFLREHAELRTAPLAPAAPKQPSPARAQRRRQSSPPARGTRMEVCSVRSAR